jgi:hypothetical protein
MRVKGFVQTFELGGKTRLIPSAVKKLEARQDLPEKNLIIQSHERSIKSFTAA